MTENDHYKYGLSGDKVDVEVAERLRAKIREKDALIRELESDAQTTTNRHVDEAVKWAGELAEATVDRDIARVRISKLEAALRTACDWLSAELHAFDNGSPLDEPDATKMRSFLARAYAVLGLAAETKGDENGK